MNVDYEWDCETVADDGDVIDHMHAFSYAEVKAWSAANPCEPVTSHALVLVRDDDSGRAWAYLEDGRLPEFFSDAGGADVSKVPQRFHREVLKAAA